MYKLGKASKRNLGGVDRDMQAVVYRAIEISEIDFSVVDGLRTIEEQEALLQAGKTWTLDSKHLSGEAVDIYPWVDGATSHDPEHYKKVAKAMFKASQQLGVELEWGGFWNEKQLDMPHWQKVA
jgi:peptidoglycan L-alanyl-D-glutamate endopeptidase CwlK